MQLNNDLGNKFCEKRVMCDTWHFVKCGKPAKIEFKGKYYCGRHDPIKREEKRMAKQAKWDKEYAEDKEKFLRQSLMSRILGAKTTVELEQMVKEKEDKNAT